MAKVRLHSYVNEIFDIAGANSVDVSVGYSMFMHNVDKGSEVYKGAKGVNWASLKEHAAELRESQPSYATKVRVNLQEIANLRKAGKRAEAKALVEKA